MNTSMNTMPRTILKSFTAFLATTASMLAASSWAIAAGAEESSQVEQDQVEMEEVTVLAKRRSMSRELQGTKLPVALIDIPQSITLIDRELMDDQGVIELKDALRNSAGVFPGGAFEGFDYYRIRGFDSSSYTLIDGLTADPTFWTQEELYGVERVEVLKGPGSTTFGQSPAGGLVNLVSKRPTPDNFLDGYFAVGSFDNLELGLDGNRVLSEGLSGRAVALYRARDSFVDLVPLAERYFFAPSLTWDIGENTSLTLFGQYINEDTGVAQAHPAEGTVLPNPGGKVPRHWSMGEPNFPNGADLKRTMLGWEFSHQFNDAISFRQIARYTELEVDFQAIYPWFISDDLLEMNRYFRWQTVDSESFATDNNLIAEFETGSIEHVMVFGIDYMNWDLAQTFAFNFTGVLPPISIFNPVYGQPVAPITSGPFSVPGELDRIGYYVQDFIQLTDRFSVLVGGRYDKSDDGTTTDSEFSPRAGISFQVLPGASLYASYAESFLPQAGSTDIDGNPLPPETGKQFELGLKTQLFNDRVTGTIAVYELTRENIAVTDARYPGEFVSRAVGEQRSRGFEVDGVVRLTPSWELVASYAYTDAEVTNDTDFVVGAPKENVPKNAINAWTKYVIPGGTLAGLGFSAGVTYYSDQPGAQEEVADPSTKFDLPSYTVAQVAVSYGWRDYDIRFNVDNLFDERYYPASAGRTFVLPGKPRSYRLTFGFRF